jgi:hypothetical protein
MPNRIEDTNLPARRSYGSFVARYPDFPSWFDGAVWELDVEEEIAEPLNQFRASLHYQANVLGLKIATRTRSVKQEDGTARRKFLVQALEA